MILALALLAAASGPTDPVALADPFLGVDGGGNTVPGAAVPFGFVSLSPDTSNGSTSGYDSGGLILGFSHTHVSGTGGASKYGNFRVTPAIGDDAWGNLAFAKSAEEASPGYYAVTIGREGKQVRAELTASRLAGFHRYLFPQTSQGRIMLDASATIPLGGGGPRSSGGIVRVIDRRHIAGGMSFVGGWGRETPYTLHFYAEFDRPAAEIGRWHSTRGTFVRDGGVGISAGGDTRPGLDNRLGIYATFDTRRDPAVQVKLGVSFVSEEQARRNLQSELPGWSFEAAHSAARGMWADALGKIEVEGGSGEQRRIFASALYRAQVMPHDLSGENIWWRSDEPHYEDFYTIWDTFRTLHPLLTLIQPQRQRDMVRSLLDTYRHTGWLPDARIAGATGPSQGGSNGDVLIADAVVKRLGGFDGKTAIEALLKDGEVQSPDPLNQGRELRDYLSLGYMSLSQTRSASRTLEYAFDDYAIASAAAVLGRADISRRYAARSRNWTNLWDDRLQCIHPRYADGGWAENFDCGREYPDATSEWWDAPFYEGSSRQYSTFVPHDVAGLVRRLGGKAQFVRWLDAFFRQGAYNHGNEPDILAPWLYIHAGRPDRTAERVRAIMASNYHEGRSGLPGNDDAGALSSWYVWAALGLFPNAGQPFYYIGSPLFVRSTIHLEQGRSFVIEAPATSAANLYVQSAELNGKPLDRAWLTHSEIARGGKLVLHMGASPNAWAHNAPPPPQFVDLAD
jgi:predicted alpha-1,2-mannosidase